MHRDERPGLDSRCAFLVVFAAMILIRAVPLARVYVVPWFRVADPSVRYLIPLYPLYALVAAHGVSRGTGRFAGRAGVAAGIALAVTALSFPVELGSTGSGRMSVRRTGSFSSGSTTASTVPRGGCGAGTIIRSGSGDPIPRGGAAAFG